MLTCPQVRKIPCVDRRVLVSERKVRLGPALPLTISVILSKSMNLFLSLKEKGD